MKLRRRLLLAAAGLGAALLILAGLSRRSLFSRTEVALYEVHSGDFGRRVTAEGTLKAVQATPVTAPMEAQGPLKIAWLAPDGSRVRKDEVLFRFDPTDFQNRLEEGKRDRATAGNKIEKSNAETLATRRNLQRDSEQAGRELTAARTFQKRDAEIFSRSQIIESEIDETLAAEKREYAENVLTVRDRLSRAEREILAIEGRKAQSKIRQAEQGLSALEVRAPHDGILVLRKDWRGEVPRVGETVWSGQPLAEIPNLGVMEAEVFVLEADAGGLAVGQAARVTVESRPGVDYRGRVSRVDAIAKPRMRGVPVQYFGVTLELARTDVSVMKPGARVAATLDVGQRSPALSVPLQAVFEKERKKIVYRWRRGRFEEVPISVGASSLGRIVVAKGLAPGDRIALRDPTQARSEGPAAEKAPGAAAGATGPSH